MNKKSDTDDDFTKKRKKREQKFYMKMGDRCNGCDGYY